MLRKLCFRNLKSAREEVVHNVWAVTIAGAALGSAAVGHTLGGDDLLTKNVSRQRFCKTFKSVCASVVSPRFAAQYPCHSQALQPHLLADSQVSKTLPLRSAVKEDARTSLQSAKIKQRVYFWGDRISLPYDAESCSTSRVLEKKSKSRTPTLESEGPLLEGHFGPHISEWFDHHPYGWKSLTLGSHFGAAVTLTGDLFLWGSFIPPVVLGPAPIVPKGTLSDTSLKTTSKHPIPELTIVLHQSVAKVPTENRTPTYAENICIREAEERFRVFVGPVKIPLPFKVKEAKAGVNKFFALTTSGQVYCLDDLIGMLHWTAYDYYLVPVPPICNPYTTQHSVVVDMKSSVLENGNEHAAKRRVTKPASLTSLLPKTVQHEDGGDQFGNACAENNGLAKSEARCFSEEQPIKEIKSNVAAISTLPTDDSRTPALLLINSNGALVQPQYPGDAATASETSTKISTNEAAFDTVFERPVAWLERPSFFHLSQLPQPGFLWGKGVKTFDVGYDHMCCLTDTGELFCMGDNKYGQCGVDPDIPGQSVVGISRVRHPLGRSSRQRITAIACGHYHTAFQDAEGVIYTFGSDQHLQLGHGDTRQNIGFRLKPTSAASLAWNKEQLLQDRTSPIQSVVEYGLLTQRALSTPTAILLPAGLQRNAYAPPDKLICGAESTCFRFITSPPWLNDVALTTDIYCSGNNLRGQCGSNESLSQQPFHRVKLPVQFHALEMACGAGHCLAFLSDGELYGWGDNRTGQVGVKKPRKITFPSQVRLTRRTKEQRLLHQALPKKSSFSSKPEPNKAETLQAQGLIADFKDETTQLDELERQRMQQLKELSKLTREPLVPEIHAEKPQRTMLKPIFRLSPDYGGDVSFIACGFDSTGVIQNVRTPPAAEASH